MAAGGQPAPAAQLIRSPYDLESRDSTQRALAWGGSQTGLTEICAVDEPHCIAHGATIPAPTRDASLTDPMQQALLPKALLPATHRVDRGCIDAERLVHSLADAPIEWPGPLHRDRRWPAQAGAGLDRSDCQIDGAARQATGPHGHSAFHQPVIRVHVADADGAACACRAHCVHSAQGPRTLPMRCQAEQEALPAGRARQSDPEFKRRYARRAGVASLISQGVRASSVNRATGVQPRRTCSQSPSQPPSISSAWPTGSALRSNRARHSRFAALAPAA